MRVSVQKDTPSKEVGKQYRLNIGKQKRSLFFKREWISVQIKIWNKFHFFEVLPGFWRKCPEIRDDASGTIRDWLRANSDLTWKSGAPPEVGLVPLGDGKFELTT